MRGCHTTVDTLSYSQSVSIGDSLIGAGSLSFIMPEEVLFKSESDQTREEIASYLRSVADKLEQGDAITLKSGSESVTMEPPARPTFEVKAEREGPTDGPGELSIEFELEWDENGNGGDSGSGKLEIE